MSQSLGAMTARTPGRARKELPADSCLRDSALLAACSKTGSAVSRILHSERLPQFVKFCLVGGSGVFVDMGVLFLLADPRCLGLNATLSKVCSAETAMASNFVWNEVWTFRETGRPTNDAGRVVTRLRPGIFRRVLVFNGICGVGIILAVLLLFVLHKQLGSNLYLANLVAIGVGTIWNFSMNARFNWRVMDRGAPPPSG